VTEDLDEFGSESGSKLREKLEAEIAKNRVLHEKLTERIVREHKFVSVEDLKGVSYDQLEAHAAEVEKAKTEQRSTILRETLVEKGIPEDQLDAALERLVGSEKATPPPATTRVASLGGLQGTAPQKVPQEGLFGASRIRAAVAQQS
jgi:hypothetical protein